MLRPKFRVNQSPRPEILTQSDDILGYCAIADRYCMYHLMFSILRLSPFAQDLVFIEEAFERLLLDYDRVFSAMGIPACLWRRTGEIYKGNREFAELVGVEGHMLREVGYGS